MIPLLDAIHTHLTQHNLPSITSVKVGEVTS